MNLHLERIKSDDDTTISNLWIESRLFCFGLEDEHRDVKISGETRIPAGTYQILPRLAGGMIQRYKARFRWHKGMLHLQNVPGFKYVYIHVGNTDEDTAGCLLVGFGADIKRMALQSSVAAYRALYERVYADAEGGILHITIKDRDR